MPRVMSLRSRFCSPAAMDCNPGSAVATIGWIDQCVRMLRNWPYHEMLYQKCHGGIRTSCLREIGLVDSGNGW